MPDIKVPTSIQYGQIKPGNTAGMIEAGVAAGNISRPGDEEVMELPEVSCFSIGAILCYTCLYTDYESSDALINCFAGEPSTQTGAARKDPATRAAADYEEPCSASYRCRSQENASTDARTYYSIW